MKENALHSYLSAGEEYINDLYEIFLDNPLSVPEDWRAYFRVLGSDISHAKIQERFLALAQSAQQNNFNPSDYSTKYHSQYHSEYTEKKIQINKLVYNYRKLGHFQAKLDPLDIAPKLTVSELDLAYYNFKPTDLEKTFAPDHFRDNAPISLNNLIKSLQDIYCKTIGAEYLHINSQTEVHWIQDRLENFQTTISQQKKLHILKCLTAAEGLEKYLGSKYVGQKRFSLEGGESLIVLLDQLIQHSGENNIREIVIGMAHRGRLNVLVNALGKSPQELFNEFEGKNYDKDYSGDVKYHKGFSSDVNTPGGGVHLSLGFNPSHLEIISPVVTGSVYARQQRRLPENRTEVMGVQIHGDAAFAGQGVVMETFSLSQTKGFGTLGTIHIIINNQIGFTTDAVNTRSTYYCTDIAKMVQAPIFHVNADDPEAVLFITKLAVDYRMKFNKDIVIDLICYRRLGHNESDEPSATQPVMYQHIRRQPTVRKIYADRLIQSGVLSENDAADFVAHYQNSLDKAENPLPVLLNADQIKNPFPIDWQPHINQDLSQDLNQEFSRKFIQLDLIKKLGTEINTVPENMVLQPQVSKVIENNRKMAAGEMPMNWGFAENLAYASLLTQGYSIRLSGQDCGRGTFSHRHAVWHHYENGDIYIPLKNLALKIKSNSLSNLNQANLNQEFNHPEFNIIDSILSEEAVVGFEYGYSTTMPETLVIWEAQFGDFANGAQVVIDQFISSGEQKWKRFSGLTLLLPHGYEGMGAEHSSARLERFLQLCAQDNIQVCVPTTPAQIFHLLRRQMLCKSRKPLMIMTPKSMLRHKLAISSLEELSTGKFEWIINETDNLSPDKITRVVFCAGKIYYDLLESRRKNTIENIVLIRIEQLYPFDTAAVKKILNDYKRVKDIIWCQEEPKNQGAWSFILPLMTECLNKNQILRYFGRKACASPAVGLAKLHLQEQQQIVSETLDLNA